MNSPNYFEILGVHPIRLNLEVRELERRFYELASQIHPDKNQQSAASVKTAAQLNAAYQTLKNPWSRALYFLGSSELESAPMPTALAEFYFKVFEGGEDAELHSLETEILNSLKTQEGKLLQIFENFDRQSSLENLNSMKELVIENRYLRSMLRNLRNKRGDE